MKVLLINIGKTEEAYLSEGQKVYEKRLQHYCNFETVYLTPPPAIQKLPANRLKTKESELIQKHLKPGDYLILLDEKGRQFRSVEMASWLGKFQVSGIRRIVFITGGAFGFHESLYQLANEKLSLSSLTFPHQLVRLIFLEQLYRAFTILRNEPYHNE